MWISHIYIKLCNLQSSDVGSLCNCNAFSQTPSDISSHSQPTVSKNVKTIFKLYSLFNLSAVPWPLNAATYLVLRDFTDCAWLQDYFQRPIHCSELNDIDWFGANIFMLVLYLYPFKKRNTLHLDQNGKFGQCQFMKCATAFKQWTHYNFGLLTLLFSIAYKAIS